MELQNLMFFMVAVYLRTALVDCQCDQRPYGGSMMCCAGRNSHCSVKIRNLPKNSTSTRKICYCDEYCKLTKDCCSDYDKIQEACRGMSAESIFIIFLNSNKLFLHNICKINSDGKIEFLFCFHRLKRSEEFLKIFRQGD